MAPIQKWIGAIVVCDGNAWYYLGMDAKELVASVDAEIAKLVEVRRLLVGNNIPKRGRNSGAAKRVMSPAARASIAAAQKKRWAEWHKTHSKKK